MTEKYNEIKHYAGQKRIIEILRQRAEERSDQLDLRLLKILGGGVDVLNSFTTNNQVTEYPGIRQRDSDVDRIKKERGKSEGLDYFVATLDLDDFGKFNKQHGQDVGDKILRTTLEILSEGTREADVYHSHGEEIDLILQARNEDEARGIVDRLRRELEEKSLVKTNNHYKITGTFGLTRWDVSNEAYEEARKRADRAMQSGKTEGKNCVRYASVIR
ncbi:MAG: diguanylate cyclase [Nanoarchaeota archaeon]